MSLNPLQLFQIVAEKKRSRSVNKHGDDVK